MTKISTFDQSLADVHPDWIPVVANSKPLQLAWQESEQLRTQNAVFPPSIKVFEAFRWSGIKETRVVILGQDPYHGAGQATGLAFAVPRAVSLPPSLRNIFQELRSDIGWSTDFAEDARELRHWASQGVLLLNTTLTVTQDKPLSHAHLAWPDFTDDVISRLNRDSAPKVFMLWGKSAQRKSSLVSNKQHLVLTAPHPSPLSSYRGFFGCKHFSKANAFLEADGRHIEWV